MPNKIAKTAKQWQLAHFILNRPLARPAGFHAAMLTYADNNLEFDKSQEILEVTNLHQPYESDSNL